MILKKICQDDKGNFLCEFDDDNSGEQLTATATAAQLLSYRRFQRVVLEQLGRIYTYVDAERCRRRIEYWQQEVEHALAAGRPAAPTAAKQQGAGE